MSIASIKKKYHEYLEFDCIKKLNLSDSEIIKNLHLIIAIVDFEKKCASLPNNKCASDNFYHLALERDKNTKQLIKVSKKCSKYTKNNWLFDDFSDTDKIGLTIACFEQQLIDIELDKKNDAIIDRTPQETNKLINDITSNSKEFSKLWLIKKYYHPIFNQIKKSNINKLGFYLFGDYGVGKTLIMHSFGNSINYHGYSTFFIKVNTLLAKIKESFDTQNNIEGFIEQIKETDFLFLDDIGSETANEWFYNNYLLPIIDFRIEKKKSTFFTSNYNVKDYANKLVDKVKMTKVDALRVIDRIKSLANNRFIHLVDKNYR